MNLHDVLRLVDSVYAGLALPTRCTMAAAMSIKLKRQLPLSLFLIGGPGSGKSTVLDLVMSPGGAFYTDSVIRVDDISPAAFVSNAMNRTADQLEKIDLISQINGRIMKTKEASPLFIGNEEQIGAVFAKLVSVLDGTGFVRASGTHGRRGPDSESIFTWLAGIAEGTLNASKLGMMNTIGNRLLFLHLPGRNQPLGSWKPSVDTDSPKKVKAVVSTFMDSLHLTYENGTVEMQPYLEIPEVNQSLALMAQVICQGRTEAVRNGEKTEDIPTMTPAESPERTFQYLSQIAVGSALLSRRDAILEEDLRVAMATCLGSMRAETRKVLEVLLTRSSPCEINDILRTHGVTFSTASRWLDWAQHQGLVTEGNSGDRKSFDLNKPLKALRPIFKFPVYTSLADHRNSQVEESTISTV